MMDGDRDRLPWLINDMPDAAGRNDSGPPAIVWHERFHVREFHQRRPFAAIKVFLGPFEVIVAKQIDLRAEPIDLTRTDLDAIALVCFDSDRHEIFHKALAWTLGAFVWLTPNVSFPTQKSSKIAEREPPLQPARASGSATPGKQKGRRQIAAQSISRQVRGVPGAVATVGGEHPVLATLVVGEPSLIAFLNPC